MARRRNPLAPGGGGAAGTRRPASPRTSDFGAWTGGDPRRPAPTPGTPGNTGAQPAAPPPPAPSPAPQYTPGLDAQGLADLENLGTTTRSSLLDLNQGIADAQAGVQSDLAASEEQNRLDQRMAARNAAARGLSAGGTLGGMKERAFAAQAARNLGIDRAWRDKVREYTRGVNDVSGNYARDASTIARESGGRHYDTWKQQNPDQSSPTQATTPAEVAASAKPTWAQFRQTHPGAKTPAQIAVLRSKYNRRFGGA